MKRRQLFWFLAALPATLAGHSMAYWFAGHQQDAHHAYFSPAVEWSAVLLGAFCAYVLALALLGKGAWIAKPGDSVAASWLKLSGMQIALFSLLEHFEGYTPGAVGFLAQIVAALVAAFAIAYFTQVVRSCNRAGVQASRYARRLLRTLRPISTLLAPVAPAYALTVRAGRAHFSRPPPFA